MDRSEDGVLLATRLDRERSRWSREEAMLGVCREFRQVVARLETELLASAGVIARLQQEIGVLATQLQRQGSLRTVALLVHDADVAELARTREELLAARREVTELRAREGHAQEVIHELRAQLQAAQHLTQQLTGSREAPPPSSSQRPTSAASRRRDSLASTARLASSRDTAGSVEHLAPLARTADHGRLLR